MNDTRLQPSVRTAFWPELGDGADPFAAPDVADTHRELGEAIREVWAGRKPLAAARMLARRANLDGPLLPSAPPRSAAFVPSELDLVRLGTDHDPALGDTAPDRLLGPWARTAPRSLLLAALAHAAFLPSEGRVEAPIDHAIRGVREPALRASLKALRDAPLAPWRRVDHGVEPILPLGFAPDTSVVGLTGVANGGGFFARLLPVGDRWRAWGVLPVPAWPSSLATWTELWTWEARTSEPVATLSALLARRAHTMVCRVFEAAWTSR